MWEWLERVWELVSASPNSGRGPVFHRRFRINSGVIAWLQDPARSDADRLAFAAMLLRLDSDPTDQTFPVLKHGAPAGTRWTIAGDFRVIFVLDLSLDQISIISCA